jgi:hypothetical protein
MLTPSNIIRSAQSRTARIVASLRRSCAVSFADRDIERASRLAALTAPDGLTAEQLQQLLLEADSLCVDAARRFRVPEEVVRFKSANLRLLRALAGAKPKTVTVVLPLMVVAPVR